MCFCTARLQTAYEKSVSFDICLLLKFAPFSFFFLPSGHVTRSEAFERAHEIIVSINVKKF